MVSGTYPPELTDRYPRLRRRLVLFFDRRHAPGDELADETIARLVERLAHGPSVDNLEGFAFGVAHHIYADWQREQMRRPPDAVAVAAPAGVEARCLDDCMRRAPRDERELLESYFIEKKERPTLADALGLTLNALRQKVFKAKHRLRSCIDLCCKEQGH